jgi:hypothetical protein
VHQPLALFEQITTPIGGLHLFANHMRSAASAISRGKLVHSAANSEMTAPRRRPHRNSELTLLSRPQYFAYVCCSAARFMGTTLPPSTTESMQSAQ